MTAKRALDQIERITRGWTELRPKKPFAEMSLARFLATVQPSLEVREEIDTLRLLLEDALLRRAAFDRVSCAACQDVVRAVVGDKSEGPDGALYKALGYIPASERQTGLTRKKKIAPKAA